MSLFGGFTGTRGEWLSEEKTYNWRGNLNLVVLFGLLIECSFKMNLVTDSLAGRLSHWMECACQLQFFLGISLLLNIYRQKKVYQFTHIEKALLKPSENIRYLRNEWRIQTLVLAFKDLLLYSSSLFWFASLRGYSSDS